jgi:CBS-domain-containing membrane protein
LASPSSTTTSPARPTGSRAPCPRRATKPRPRRAADLLRDDVATADLHERIADVVPRVRASPYRFALVTGRGDVLLGRLRRAALEGDPAATAEGVMEAGPSTIRPDTEAAALARRLRERELTTAVVTDPDGVLLGVVRLIDLEQQPASSPQS